MPKFYAVEVKTIAIVQVQDDMGAYEAELMADSEQREILSDAQNNSIEFEVVGAIKSVKDLAQHGWDGRCLPYGGDGNTYLEQLLPAE